MPPRTNVAGPAAFASNAACRISPRLVPADQGPANAPRIPRAATAARRSSVSKNSETRSAMAIGPQRRSRNASRRGSAAELAADAEELPELAEGRVVDRGRRHRRRAARAPRRCGRGSRGTRATLRVVRRHGLELAGGPRRVAVERDAASAVRRGREDADLGLDERESVARRDRDPGRRRAGTGRPRGGRSSSGSPERTPPSPRGRPRPAPLEHERLEARLREVRGRRQAVGPRAEDDDVLRRHPVRPPRGPSPRGPSRPRSSRWRP